MDDHYMIAAPSSEMLVRHDFFLKAISNAGLIIAPENVQQSEPWKYQGHDFFSLDSSASNTPN